MILTIVAIKDRAADAFMRPFFVPTANMAIRSFMDEVNRDAADNQMFVHPDDFDLYEIGLFDDSTGRITSYDDMKLLILGKQAKS
jgi:hypothetical protein